MSATVSDRHLTATVRVADISRGHVPARLLLQPSAPGGAPPAPARRGRALSVTRAVLGDDCVVLAARGAVTVETMPRLHAAFAHVARNERTLALDLCEVDVPTAAAVTLLTSAVRRLRGPRGRLVVACSPGPVRSALSRTGVADGIDLIDRDQIPPRWTTAPTDPDAAWITGAGSRRQRQTVLRRAALLTDATLAIEAHHTDPDLDLPRVARRIATSSRQLQRVLAELASTTFRDELHEVRMQHAATLLHTTELPIGAIADRVGHRQPAQFSKAFRRRHGMTPAEFRAHNLGAP